MAKIKLLGKTPEELKKIAVSVGLPAFTGKQLAQWLYVKRVKSFNAMTNISKAGRDKLSERYEVGVSEAVGMALSSDGTKKYLFPVSCVRSNALNAYETAADDEFESAAIEAVMIPDDDRKTLCVSSQSGCRMGCKFCMTGRQGFHGHLSAADILSQFIAVDECHELTNAVFMGMGEPLDNYENVMRAIEVLTADWGFGWSPKRITLSTIGVIPNLKKYLDTSRCHLAVSLHDPLPDERLGIMPVQKGYPVEDVVRLVKQYDFTGQRRVSFEYTMFAGFNDTKRHEDALIRMLGGLECRVNLIRFHKIPDFPYETSPMKIMENFRDRLNAHGITCTIRSSRGEDILAACGMLAGQHSAAGNNDVK
ncbi:MAG: 23S rRNA (adenine(2503)-C(2))-methyltransferase RlmN [Bacteroidia bacterium]|nr:23S rRNA (adenine(2503)-C(2))-methyltransferase RlmN [Bacteroidia bacterium]